MDQSWLNMATEVIISIWSEENPTCQATMENQF